MVDPLRFGLRFGMRRAIFAATVAATVVMSIVLLGVVAADLSSPNRTPVAVDFNDNGSAGAAQGGANGGAVTAPGTSAAPGAPGAPASGSSGASGGGAAAPGAAAPGAAGGAAAGAGSGTGAAPGAGSSGGSPTGQSPPVPASEDAQGVTADSITVGDITLQSGVADLTPYLHGVQAYLQKVNASGGVNGRKINLVSADDGSSPSRGMEELNTMEQQDHIFSLVGECAPLTDSQSQGFIDQHGLPDVGVCTWPTAKYSDPYAYTFGISPVHIGNELAKWTLDKLNSQHTSMISEDESVVQDFADGVRQWWGARGHALSGTDDQKSPTGAPDYSTYVQNMINNHTTAVAVMLTESDTIGFCKAANQAGFHPDWVGLSANDPAVAESGQCEGMYGWADRDGVDAQTPAMQEFKSDMATYEPDEQRLPQAEQGYESAKDFVYALKALGPTVTRTRLMGELNSLRNYDDGFQPPFSFYYGRAHERTLSSKFYVIKNSKVVVAYNQWYYLQ